MGTEAQTCWKGGGIDLLCELSSPFRLTVAVQILSPIGAHGISLLTENL